jgi:hypothetical protein
MAHKRHNFFIIHPFLIYFGLLFVGQVRAPDRLFRKNGIFCQRAVIPIHPTPGYSSKPGEPTMTTDAIAGFVSLLTLPGFSSNAKGEEGSLF